MNEKDKEFITDTLLNISLLLKISGINYFQFKDEPPFAYPKVEWDEFNNREVDISKIAEINTAICNMTPISKNNTIVKKID